MTSVNLMSPPSTRPPTPEVNALAEEIRQSLNDKARLWRDQCAKKDSFGQLVADQLKMKAGNAHVLPALPGRATMRKTRDQAASGGEVSGRKRNSKRQTAHENIRCPLSYAALAEALYKSGVLPWRIYVFDDIGVHVSPRMNVMARQVIRQADSEGKEMRRQRQGAPKM